MRIRTILSYLTYLIIINYAATIPLNDTVELSVEKKVHEVANDLIAEGLISEGGGDNAAAGSRWPTKEEYDQSSRRLSEDGLCRQFTEGGHRYHQEGLSTCEFKCEFWTNCFESPTRYLEAAGTLGFDSIRS